MSEWLPISSAPKDGTYVLILTSVGVVQAQYCPGEWSDHHEYGPQYEGPVWSCYDDAFQIEIEETPEGDFSEAKYWIPLPATPPELGS